MTVFIALLMSMAAFALVGYPLVRTKRGQSEALSTNHREADDLLAERDAAYAAIKELEFEYHLGNLSRHDYDDLRARYRQRAADVLRRLDIAEREAAAAAEKALAAGPSRDGPIAEDIERAVTLLRRQLETNAPLTCPACRRPAQPDDRFCGGCGAPLPARRSGGAQPSAPDHPPSEEK